MESTIAQYPSRRLCAQDLNITKKEVLAYKFRPYPDHEQEEKLLWTKEVCRRVYNRFLELYNASEHHRFKPQALMPMWK